MIEPRPDLREDHIAPTENWGGGVVGHRPITLDNIPTIGGGRSGEAWEVPQSMINLGVALLAAAAIWGGAESSARAGGSHAHVLAANYLRLRAEELGIVPPQDNFAQFKRSLITGREAPGDIAAPPKHESLGAE